MGLTRLSSILRRWGWLLILGAVVAGVAGFLISHRTVPVYRTSTQLLVNQVQNPGLAGYNDLLASERLAKTYSELLHSAPVLEETVQQLALPLTVTTLEARIAVHPVRDTQLIELTVEDTDPQRAVIIANGLARIFIDYTKSLQAGSAETGQAQLTVELTAVRRLIDDTSVRLSQARGDAAATDRLQSELSGYQERYLRLIDTQQRIALAQAQAGATVSLAVPARLPIAPVRPRPLQTTVLAALAGLVLLSGLVLLIEYFDDRIRDIEEVRRRFDIAPLTVLGYVKGGQARTMEAQVAKASGHFTEALRLLRTNLGFLSDGKPQVICVTSAVASEGKSTVAAHLATVEARASKRVVLIDADLRNPDIHTFFDLSNTQGLSLYLAGAQANDQPVFRDGPLGIRILTAGPIPPNPTELLNSPRMAELLVRLRAEADIVIIDTAPVLPVADTLVLQPAVDGTVIVLNLRRTGMKALSRLLDAIKQGQGRVLGIVFNNDRQYRGGYGYGYGYGESTGDPDALKDSTPESPQPASLILGRVTARQSLWRGRRR